MTAIGATMSPERLSAKAGSTQLCRFYVPTAKETQLPATIQKAEVTTDRGVVHVVPALVADLGDEAAWRYVEFFTPTSAIRTPGARTIARATSFSVGARIAA